MFAEMEIRKRGELGGKIKNWAKHDPFPCYAMESLESGVGEVPAGILLPD